MSFDFFLLSLSILNKSPIPLSRIDKYRDAGTRPSSRGVVLFSSFFPSLVDDLALKNLEAVRPFHSLVCQAVRLLFLFSFPFFFSTNSGLSLFISVGSGRGIENFGAQPTPFFLFPCPGRTSFKRFFFMKKRSPRKRPLAHPSLLPLSLPFRHSDLFDDLDSLMKK